MPDRLLFTLSRIQSRLTAYVRLALRKKGVTLSPGQIGILLVLDQDGETTMGHLSSTLEIDNAAITRLVDKLEKQEKVERRINPHDRRQTLIRITRQGLDANKAVKAVVQAVNQKINKGVTKEEMAIYQRVNLSILDAFK